MPRQNAFIHFIMSALREMYTYSTVAKKPNTVWYPRLNEVSVLGICLYCGTGTAEQKELHHYITFVVLCQIHSGAGSLRMGPYGICI